MRNGFSCPAATPLGPVFALPGPVTSLCPHSSDHIRCWNLNQLSIGYGFRPRLRSRLTQGRSALPWNPWIFGHVDSHNILATHSGILSSEHSTAPYRYSFDAFRLLLYQCIKYIPELRCRVSAPEIFGAGPLDQCAITHSLHVCLLLSQRPGCLRNPTSFST